MNFRNTLCLPLLVWLLTACQHSPKSFRVSTDAVEAAGEPQSVVMMDAPAMASVDEEELQDRIAVPEKPEPNGSPLAPSQSRKIVYHAKLRIKVPAMAPAVAGLDSLITRFGAYVENVSETRQEGEWENQLEIRVAPQRFQEFLSQLNGLGTLEVKTIGQDDITAQHADVTARLATKRALEQRYLALLKQAKKVSEMLEIEQKLGEVREEIESAEARLRTMNEKVAYSTITLTLYQPLVLSMPDAPVLSFRSRLVEAIYSGWERFTQFVLNLIAIWPVVLIGVVATLAIRLWWRRRAMARSVNHPSYETQKAPVQG